MKKVLIGWILALILPLASFLFFREGATVGWVVSVGLWLFAGWGTIEFFTKPAEQGTRWDLKRMVALFVIVVSGYMLYLIFLWRATEIQLNKQWPLAE